MDAIDIRREVIDSHIDDLGYLIEDLCRSALDNGPTTLESIERRRSRIALMRHIHTNLTRLTSTIAKCGINADKLHFTELQQTRPMPAIAGPPPLIQIASIPSSIPSSIVSKQLIRRPITITGTHTITAAIVPPSLTSVTDIYSHITDGGGLFYISQWNHFAIRINGCVFHANIGRIYCSGSGPPSHVRNCRGGGSGGGRSSKHCGCDHHDCMYYHNPEDFLGSRDVRNYTADSWMYTPASEVGRINARRFGSIDSLETDMKMMTADSIQHFMSQTMHDILCSLILHNINSGLNHD